MDDWLIPAVNLSIALVLVALNGFFVAAEFALVRLRGGQLDALVKERRPFSQVAFWLGWSRRRQERRSGGVDQSR